MSYIERIKCIKSLGFIIVLSLITLSSCSPKVVYPAPTSLTEDYVTRLSEEKKIAYSFVTSSKSSASDLTPLLDENFRSHDRQWGGDREGYIAQRNSDESFDQIKPIRMIQDDSLVAIHSRMLGDTLKFRWDIVQIDNYKVRTHWSNSFDSIGLNPSGHTEIDGPVIPEQLENTNGNRALITRFMDQCMIREDGGALDFFDSELYIQHNRDVGDGLWGLAWAMVRMTLKGETIKFKDNYHVIAEGNLVLSASEGYVGDHMMAFYDFFRIENNKIIEHWDIIAPIDTFMNYIPDDDDK